MIGLTCLCLQKQNVVIFVHVCFNNMLFDQKNGIGYLESFQSERKHTTIYYIILYIII